MMHASALSESRIKANLTRCRKSHPQYESRLSKWHDEIRSLELAGKPVPEWIYDRIRSCQTKIWFYQTRIKQYEDELMRLDDRKEMTKNVGIISNGA